MKRLDGDRGIVGGLVATRASLADAKEDAGLNAMRLGMMEYTRLREDLSEERLINANLVAQLHELKRHAAMEEDRMDALFASLRRVHRSLYRGSTFEHILRASMDVTAAERGYYVAERDGALVVLAAVDVPAQVGDAPSPFIAELARRVLRAGESIHWTAEASPEGLTPARDERFREGIAVAVSTLGTPHGVIIALDKDGCFHETDLRSLISVGEEAGVVLENTRLRDDVQDAYISTISLLADAVQAKDAYTHGHCEQVSQYARAAAELLGLTADEKRVTSYAALLHDVGKIGVSDGVLNKPGPLIEEERKLVQAHVRIGHDLLMGVPALREVAHAVLHHHEWYDGAGYPAGLVGEDIPIASRIVAAIDAYCAMIDERSYKRAYTPEYAREELRRCSGTQFDPTVVVAVLKAIEIVDGDRQADRATLESYGLRTPPLLTE